jgi:hypothetical protein
MISECVAPDFVTMRDASAGRAFGLRRRLVGDPTAAVPPGRLLFIRKLSRLRAFAAGLSA